MDIFWATAECEQREDMRERMVDAMPKGLDLLYRLYGLFSSEHFNGLGRPFDWEGDYKVHGRGS